MIIIEPKGGLCNRIRFIDSARALCQDIGGPITILWRHDSQLDCDYNVLFDPCDTMTVIEKRYTPDPAGKLLAGLLFLRDFAACRLRYRHVIFESRLRRLLQRNYDFTDLKRYSSVYIAGCSRFYRKQRKLLPLPVNNAILHRVNAIAGRFSPDTAGIHIRRTDHTLSARLSPDSAFINAIQEQIRNRPQTNFFLATDSPETERKFRELFGDRIITSDKEISRYTVQGVQDAMVDLLCLSKTSKIIGSQSSSFSGTAAQISDIVLETVDSKDPKETCV